ncbi:PH domain-containing protein [Amycolatopsis minnesotensis]|uniref:PH domain-containing protein n=1 Tax=Amycolatopsis minnesotensis TaxID=337894 RepID=A0ABP5D0K4_9PSEU
MTDTLDTATEVEWRKLSPKMLAVHPVQEVVRLLPVLVGVLFLGREGHGPTWSLIGLGLAVGFGLIRWFTTTYQVTPHHVRVRRGLVRRRVLSVPRDRVRSVDLTSHILQRVLGLSRVVIGTGRSDKHDEGVTLDALSVAEAARLREELLHQRTVAAEPATTDTAETSLAVLDRRWIRFGPFTLGGLAAVGFLAGIYGKVSSEVDLDPEKFGPLRAVVHEFNAIPLPLAIAASAVVFAVVIGLLSTIGYVVTFWNYRLTRHREGTLHVSRGLITSRSTTIEERRLRGVEVSESLLLRMVRGGRLLAITTGLRVGHGAEHGGSLLLPPAPLGEVQRVAREVYPDGAAVTCELTRHTPAARRRRHLRAYTFAAVVTGALLVLHALSGFPAWAWQVSLLLFPIGFALAEDRYRNLGHALRGRSFAVRQGSLVRRRHVLDTDGIIGVTVHESLFQRRSGLATLTVTTAAGKQHCDALDVGAQEAVDLADRAVPGLLTPFLR